ncbi:ATP-binding protein [Pseudomonas sp. RIT-PI-AD]|uniref:ATP-binding response regulator n=1 Tax=Pseudomonas sp. RIT-PI-AD TaxID=3035294 RepID=UPI0021D814F8|nr:ATP-binding protein [Pseudomonas sp. RIT-PI-AD]
MHDPGLPLCSVPIATELDVVRCRQQAKQIAAWLGLGKLDQIRIATCVSELARNIYQYAAQGRFDFYLNRNAKGELNGFGFEARDQGKGIENVQAILDGSYVSTTGMGIGLRGAQRLMDEFTLESSERGTRIHAVRHFPARPFPDPEEINAFRQQVDRADPLDPYQVMQAQNKELLVASSELRHKQQELEDTNLELENTNKGVVALYSELEKTAQELKEAGEAKSRFFSNMTHEFRTPINIIENISKLLLSGVDGSLNDEQNKQVRFISDAAIELSNLVNELLELAEVQSGRMTIQPEAFGLCAFMEKLEAFTSALSLRYPLVDYQVDRPAEDIVIHSDQNRLFQILRNLISNAFKYTPRGRVKVKCYHTDANTLEFMVADTGIGISAENQRRVFDEFYRIKSSGLRNIEGTGLGLSLAQKVATLLKGELDLSSREGVGSKFYLRLPLEYEGSAVGSTHFDLSGTTILLIDDNPADRYIVTKALAAFDPILIEAESAKASMDKLNVVRPDIIFLDLDLPDISGEDLLESMDWSMHRRVLVNTAKHLTDEDRARLAPYCYAILQKSEPGYVEQVLRQVKGLSGSLKHERT